MSPIIQKLKLPDENYKFIIDNKTKDSIENLSKLNIFIGQNNSGKSRLMRTLLSEEVLNFFPNPKNVKNLNPDFILKEDEEKDIIKLINNGISKIREYENKTIEMGDDKNWKKIKEFPKIDYLKPNSNEYIEYYNDLINSINNENNGFHSAYINGVTLTENDYKNFLESLNDFFYNHDLSELNLSFNFKKVYIPILRGLIPLIKNDEIMFNEDVYNNRVIYDYFKKYKENKNFYIFSGLTIYEEIKRSLLGSLQQRESINEFESYLSENFFNGEKITLIPRLNDKGEDEILTIKIGDEKERFIYELGDGIQTILIITFPLFKYYDNIKENENVLFFIEEPELNLHPGLQRKLMETLLENPKFDNFQFFITTHSNHLLDLSIDYDDVSIFSVHKKLNEKEENNEKLAKFEIENVQDKKILDTLGVRPSSLMFSNCFIWVEGKFDRIYFKHCLNLYKKEHNFHYNEDQHYSFFQYEGDNLSHWSIIDEKGGMVVDKLFNKFFVIHDKDFEDKPCHSILSEKLGDNYYKLKCLELENLVSKDVLVRIIESFNPNFNINTNFEYKDYKNLKIGEFMYNTITNQNNINGLIHDHEGKIKLNKENFQIRAIEQTQNWEDLSENAKDITLKIVDFIEISNK